jgi:hypothetical protein
MLLLIKKCIESKILLRTLLNHDETFDSLKHKFPEILADLTSARINSNCSCINKVKLYLISKLENEEDYFNGLFRNENLRSQLIHIMESTNNKLKRINKRIN